MSARPSQFARFLALVKPYKWKLLFCLVLMLAITGLGLAVPALIARIVATALPSQNMTLFAVCLGGLLTVHLAGAGLRLWNGHTMRKVGGRIVFDLRRKMYTHMQRLSLSFFESRGSGEILSRMMNDVGAITQLVTGTALNTIVSVFQAAGILALLFWLDWRVALLALVIMPLHFLSYFMFESRLAHQSWKATEKNAQIHGKANEVFSAAKMVRAHSSESHEARSLVGQLREGYEIGVQNGWLAGSWGALTQSFSHVGTIIVMLACGVSVVMLDTSGMGADQRQTTLQAEVEKYIMFVTYVGMLYAPIQQLIGVASQIIPARIGLQRVFEILDLEPDVEDDPAGLRDRLRGEVEFRRVSFAYPNGKQVLTNINFSASPGQVIALVGPSGSGKTTIANLIARFYDCTGGEVLLDGNPIDRYNLSCLRDQMSLVLQETHLFRGTVRENLLYGKPDATEEEIREAARLANAHEFIEALPNGYDSIIGSQGARLSGGQRQRLAIARALIRDPRILILDEATSALDSASEQKVQDALTTLMHDRTTFIIAHRLSTIRDAHKILVLDNGRLVQQGTHDELINSDGLYRKLYDPQWAKEKEHAQEEELQAIAAATQPGLNTDAVNGVSASGASAASGRSPDKHGPDA